MSITVTELKTNLGKYLIFAPFVNKFPRDTEFYRLMTTRFGEM